MKVIITVYGIPKKFKIDRLKLLYAAFVNRVSGFDELKLEEDEIDCLFPYDKFKEWHRDILIIVEGPESIKQIEEELKTQLRESAKHHFPNALVKCIVRH